MSALARDLGRIAAETGFSGVVRVDGRDGIEVVRAYGLADRAHAIPNEPDTQFGIASGTKGLTALVVMRLVEEEALSLSTPARSLLGVDLPLVDERVTVEHLLAHRSGIGDYLDEELDLDFTEYLVPVPAQRLATTEAYLEVLDGHPQKFPPGERFAYCNSGYVLLALIAERLSARPFPDLVRDLVCTPAGLSDTAFLRSDELPGRAAVGYVEVQGTWRRNVFHLPSSAAATVASHAADGVPGARSSPLIVRRRHSRNAPKRSAPGADRGYGLGLASSSGGPCPKAPRRRHRGCFRDRRPGASWRGRCSRTPATVQGRSPDGSSKNAPRRTLPR
jgi:CubicO group peptidase (beta-lactamase class C family)